MYGRKHRPDLAGSAEPFILQSVTAGRLAFRDVPAPRQNPAGDARPEQSTATVRKRFRKKVFRNGPSTTPPFCAITCNSIKNSGWPNVAVS